MLLTDRVLLGCFEVSAAKLCFPSLVVTAALRIIIDRWVITSATSNNNR